MLVTVALINADMNGLKMFTTESLVFSIITGQSTR
jgi:hypothetical protein